MTTRLIRRNVACHDTFDTRITTEIHKVDNRYRVREVHTYTDAFGVNLRKVRSVTLIGEFDSEYEAKQQFDIWTMSC
jgi:hypothetical protein